MNQSFYGSIDVTIKNIQVIFQQNQVTSHFNYENNT
jgi:hypothetical protein